MTWHRATRMLQQRSPSQLVEELVIGFVLDGQPLDKQRFLACNSSGSSSSSRSSVRLCMCVCARGLTPPRRLAGAAAAVRAARVAAQRRRPALGPGASAGLSASTQRAGRRAHLCPDGADQPVEPLEEPLASARARRLCAGRLERCDQSGPAHSAPLPSSRLADTCLDVIASPLHELPQVESLLHLEGLPTARGHEHHNVRRAAAGKVPAERRVRSARPADPSC
jgi:hypothetical protein